ncbi:hypothetical protein KY366_05795 [Candidatus Woesearchaeota archaeon]|nr:hypothetical protein [Candidatus Woesearchaeota archaeon]
MYNAKEESRTTPVPIKKADTATTAVNLNKENDEELINLEKYPTSEMKRKTTRYKIVSD